MADDWQVGDLALCVSVRHPDYIMPSTFLRTGAVYTVAFVGKPIPRMQGERALALQEVKPRLDNHGFPETLFRKIRPHEADEQDRETIALLTGKREPA